LRQTPFTHLQGAPGLPTALPYFGFVSVAGGVVGAVGWPEAATEGAGVVAGCVTEGVTGWTAEGAVGCVTLGCVAMGGCVVMGGAVGAGRTVAGGVLATTGGRVATGGVACGCGPAL
jgi:hypothetical protein